MTGRLESARPDLDAIADSIARHLEVSELTVVTYAMLARPAAFTEAHNREIAGRYELSEEQYAREFLRIAHEVLGGGAA